MATEMKKFLLKQNMFFKIKTRKLPVSDFWEFSRFWIWDV